MKKILLVSSSSGGHIYPSLALKKRLENKYQITNLGIKGQMEERLNISNLKLVDIPNSFKKSFCVFGIIKIIKEFKNINQLIKENDLIICFGGFITFLVVLINFRRKRIFVHEQNVVLGDSLKYTYPLYDKLLLSFKNDLLKLKKSEYVSNPTTSCVLKRKDINIRSPKVMFIFGSLSSITCLEKVKSFLLNTKLNNQFLIVTSRKYESLFDEFKMKPNIVIKTEIVIKEELKIYDLVFSRGGASTLLELLTSGVEICCIPSKNVKNHRQEKNAKYLYNLGLISIINEEDFTLEKIENEILNLKKKNTYKSSFSSLDKFMEIIENE